MAREIPDQRIGEISGLEACDGRNQSRILHTPPDTNGVLHPSLDSRFPGRLAASQDLLAKVDTLVQFHQQIIKLHDVRCVFVTLLRKVKKQIAQAMALELL